MSLDKFGRSAASSSSASTGGTSHLLSPYRHGFTFTSDGNIDVENLKLSNVKSPTNDNDVCNKRYVDDNLLSLNKELNTIIEMSLRSAIRELQSKDIRRIYLEISESKKKGKKLGDDVDDKINKFNESLETIKELISQEIDKLREEFLSKIKILSDDRTVIVADMSNKIADLASAVQLNTFNLNNISILDLADKIKSIEQITKNIDREFNQFRDNVGKQMSKVYLDMSNLKKPVH